MQNEPNSTIKKDELIEMKNELIKDLNFVNIAIKKDYFPKMSIKMLLGLVNQKLVLKKAIDEIEKRISSIKEN